MTGVSDASPDRDPTLDLRSRPQRIASEPTASSWVEASAGTGKTHVLTNRVLRLLLNGSTPQRILCLTFTRAAAAEMANRLHDRLGAWTIAKETDLQAELKALSGNDPEDLEIIRARRLFAQVLDTPGGLKIQTIHAFCESLLGRFPVEAGLSANFQLLDERTSVELLRESREIVLRQDLQRSEPFVERLAVGMNEDAFSDIMGELTRERSRLRYLLEHFGDATAAAESLRDVLDLRPDENEESILKEASTDSNINRTGLSNTAKQMGQSKSKSDIARGAVLAGWLSADNAGRQQVFADYCQIFLTKKHKVKKTLVTKEVIEKDAAALEVMTVEAERLYLLQEKLRALELCRTNEALIGLGLGLLKVFQREKQNRALLDFDDLILATRDLLLKQGVALWVLYKLDGGLDHILVDEAQDTNPEQWQVIRALADVFFHGEGAQPQTRTIFAVGDSKQSIYSFQRADPAAFEAMKIHFSGRVEEAQQHWAPVNMELSFRSAPAVLQLVDAVFAQVPAKYGVSFSGETIHHMADRRNAGGCIELWPLQQQPEVQETDVWTSNLQQSSAKSAEYRLAQRIAASVRGWLNGDEILASTGEPPRAGDIMILVRSRTPLVEDIIRALRASGTAVAGIDRMRLGEQLAVMDLIALAKFVLLPSDDLNLAVLLKSPLIGLSEEALFDLAHNRDSSLWSILSAYGNEHQDYGATTAFLRQQLLRADQMPPFEFFSGLLSAQGGRRKLLGRLGREANDPLDEFLNRALEYERNHPPSMQGFLAWITSSDEEIKRDADPQRHEVRVMTVHGAKGLEAPIVILPDAASRPRGRSQLFWLEQKNQPAIPLYSPGQAYDEACAAEAREAAAVARDQEYRRLLYVALTRAKDRLYITGIAPRNAKSRGDTEGDINRGPEAPANSWYQYVEAAMDSLSAEDVKSDTGPARRFEIQSKETPQAKTAETTAAAEAPLPEFTQRVAPKEPTPPRPLTPSRPSATDPPVRSPLSPVSPDPFKRGNLIHKLLQVLPDIEPAGWRSAAKAYLAQPAHELTPGEQAEIADTTMAVLTHEGLAELFEPGSRAEVPLVGVLGDEAISGQIDRLRITDSEILIVDYKTNRPAPSEPSEVAKIYLRQLAAYRALLREIYPGKATRCALLWTDGPKLMTITNELLDPYAP